MARISPEALGYSAAALQSGDFKAAFAVRNQERGTEERSFDDSSCQILRLILSRTPMVLADCPDHIIQPLRIASAMMELWGTNTIKEFVIIEGEIDYRFGAEAIALMLHSHASFLLSLESFREVGITRLKLLGSRDSADCDACRAADGLSFTIDTVPELPLADCRCETGYGCRVMVIADVDAV